MKLIISATLVLLSLNSFSSGIYQSSGDRIANEMRIAESNQQTRDMYRAQQESQDRMDRKIKERYNQRHWYEKR